MKKIIYIFIILFLLTGCTATYDLDISSIGFKESLTINATSMNENENLILTPINVYYDVQENDENITKKEDNIDYYESSEKFNADGLKSINYNYIFEDYVFSRSSIVKNTFETVILKKYDHDEDGIDDYMLLTTSDDFGYFDSETSLEKVIININCHYKVISSNADEVNGNIHTWIFTAGDTDSINMVYDPDKIVDNRTIGQKIIDNEYFQVFLILMLIVITGIVCFFILKKKSDFKNRI